MTNEHNGHPGEVAKAGGFKLTREMGLALTGLLFVGAVGGWYLWNTNQSAPVDTVAVSPAANTQPSAAQANPNDAATPAAPAAGAKPATAGSVTRAPNPVEVPQIPFLTPAQKAAAAKTPGAKPAAPAQVSAEGLPAQNPFRPFRVAAAPSTAAPSNSQPSPVSNAGAFPPPRIATGGGRTVSFSAPTVLPAARPAPSAPPVAIRTGGVLPPPALPVGGNIPPAPPLQTGTAVTITPPPVAQPSMRTPVPTLRAPKLNAGTAPSVSAPAGSTASTPGGLPSSATPLPGANAGVPAVLGELDPTLSSGAAAPTAIPGAAGGTAPATPGNALEQYVADQQVSVDAVILGPTNTGIFKTRGGFVVAAIGQKLEGSDVLVKNLTASSVTLALGNVETTLDLDKR